MKEALRQTQLERDNYVSQLTLSTKWIGEQRKLADERGREVERLRGALHDISAANQLAFASDAANHMLGIARRALAAPAAAPPAEPCGCIPCRCEDEIQCQGCGAKMCARHEVERVAMPPAAQEHPDTARLDWLEKWIQQNIYHHDLAVMSDNEDGIWVSLLYRAETGKLRAHCPLDPSNTPTTTLRAAIDAARTAPEAQNG